MTRDIRLLCRVWLKPQNILPGCKSWQYMLYIRSTPGIRVFDQDSRAAQDHICQGLYITPTQRWSGWISRGLVSKLSRLWLLEETFSSLRYRSSSSKKTNLKWKQEYKIRELSLQSSDALNILQCWCYLITVQSRCGSQSAFLKYCKEWGYRKKNHRKISKETFCRVTLESSAWGEKCLGTVCWKYGPFNPTS